MEAKRMFDLKLSLLQHRDRDETWRIFLQVETSSTFNVWLFYMDIFQKALSGWYYAPPPWADFNSRTGRPTFLPDCSTVFHFPRLDAVLPHRKLSGRFSSFRAVNVAQVLVALTSNKYMGLYIRWRRWQHAIKTLSK
jgi:hypothetical protein